MDIGIPAEVLILGSVIVLLAAFTMSITGFGFALIAAPLLLFFLDPKSVIVANLILSTIICLLILRKSWHLVRLRYWIPLVIGCLLGIPLGVCAILQATASVLKMVIGILVVVFAVLLACGYRHKFKKERLASGVFGFISGVLSSSTSLSGPPVILFLLNQNWTKELLRTNLVAYFLLCGLSSLIALGISGVITSSILLNTAFYIPSSIIGFLLGLKVLPHLNELVFRKIAILIVIIAGVLAIVTSFNQLSFNTL